MRCPLFTRIVAFAASAGVGLGSGAPEAQPTSTDGATNRARSPRAVAMVSASATVVDGAMVKFPRPDRSGPDEPSLVDAGNAAVAVARSTYVDQERGMIVISLDFS